MFQLLGVYGTLYAKRFPFIPEALLQVAVAGLAPG